MIQVSTVSDQGTSGIGLRVTMPGADHADMMVILCKSGFIMCGYLNISVAERLSDVAAIVGGKDFGDLLANPVSAATTKAREMGVEVGMPGREAMAILNT